MSPERARKFWRMSLGIILFVLLLALSSCSSKDKEIVLEYWTHEDMARNELEDRLIAEFVENNPGIKINRILFSSSELLSLLPKSFDAGKAPDVFTLQQDYIQALLASDKLSEVFLESFGYDSLSSLEDIFLSDAFDGVRKNGTIYGIPMEYTNWCLYVNKGIFRRAGLDPEKDIPRTWEDIVRISSALVERDDGILTTRGFDFRYPYYLTFFIPMVNQLGGDIVDEEGRLAVVNEDAWEKAFSFLSQWGPMESNLGSPTYINARSIFNKGEIAMMLSGLYQEERLENENPDLYFSSDWAVVPFPVFEGGLDVPCAKYCHYWCVNGDIDKKKQEAAWSFVAFLSEHAEEYLTKVKLILPKREIFENLSKYDIPFLDVFASDLEKASFIYSGPKVHEVSNILESLIREVMLSGLESEKAVIRLRVSLAELRRDIE